MRNFLSRRAMTAGLIGVPAAALAPPAIARPEPIEFERYLAFLHHEIRALLAEKYPDIDPARLPICWVPEGFEHPTGAPMKRARAVLDAAQVMTG